MWVLTLCQYQLKTKGMLVLGLNIFTKRITGIWNLVYERILLKTPSLEYRITRGNMTKTFEIIHGFYDPKTICSLFKLNKSAGTRRQLFELSKEDSSY